MKNGSSSRSDNEEDGDVIPDLDSDQNSSVSCPNFFDLKKPSNLPVRKNSSNNAQSGLESNIRNLIQGS